MFLPLNSPQAENSSQVWSILNFDLPILENQDQYRLYLETQPRYNLSEHRNERFFLNSALGYRLNSKFSIWLGYLWNTTGFRLEDGDRLQENRPWQQINYSETYRQLAIGHRLRFEQRMIEDQDSTIYRLRYQIRASHPLLSFQQKTLGLTLADEVVYNFSNPSIVGNSGWTRNRIFFGPYLTGKNYRLEIGYQNERIRIDDNWNRNNHILLTSLSFVY